VINFNCRDVARAIGINRSMVRAIPAHSKPRARLMLPREWTRQRKAFV
jgi:hypothetical protein